MIVLGSRCMSLADLGLIGNCQLSAIVRRDGAIVWCCMPRFDSPPIFGALLDESDGGSFTIGPAAPAARASQRYLPNTNVLETRFESPDGAFRVLDFAPRFMQYERSFRPTKLVRIVEPLRGHAAHPRAVRSGARLVASSARDRELGSHHIDYRGLPSRAAPHHRRAAVLPRRRAVRAHRAQALRARLGRAGRGAARAALRALPARDGRATGRRWVKHCDIPPHLPGRGDPLGARPQAPLLRGHRRDRRGAHHLDPRGAGRGPHLGLPLLLAARRVLRARRVPAARPLRRARAVHAVTCSTSRRRAPDLDLAPLYRIDGKTDLDERILDDWPGFDGERPGAGRQRRRAAQAARRVRRDGARARRRSSSTSAFASSVTPPVLDLRRRGSRGEAIAVAGTPDAGIWEFRTEWRPQTFSSAHVLGRRRSHGAASRARHAPATARRVRGGRRRASATRS